jgi:uncharacterized protein (DUF1330 family)
MPKGYAIFTEHINDPDGLAAYAQEAMPTIFATGGSVVVAGPPAEALEGEWHGHQTVILEFPTVEAAQAWYHSPEYQAVIGKRHAAAETNAVIFAGFEMPTS